MVLHAGAHLQQPVNGILQCKRQPKQKLTFNKSENHKRIDISEALLRFQMLIFPKALISLRGFATVSPWRTTLQIFHVRLIVIREEIWIQIGDGRQWKFFARQTNDSGDIVQLDECKYKLGYRCLYSYSIPTPLVIPE